MRVWRYFHYSVNLRISLNMSKSIEHISVFGEYKKPEDRVTAALLHVLNAGGQPIVERLFGDLFDIPANDINIISQAHHENSIPDGEISCDCKYTVYIESKIALYAINQTQLANHLQLTNPAENKYLCYITPDPDIPQELVGLPVGWLSWKDVIDYLSGILADGIADRLLFFLIEQLIQLIKHVVYKERGFDAKDAQLYMPILDDERVIIVGGRWGEDVAKDYGFYACQENRFFMPAKYIAFYHQKRIKYVFEIEEINDSVDISTISHIVQSNYFSVKEVNYIPQKRKYMKLHLVHTCEPVIQNDKVDKNGKPCAFIQGQTYTSFSKIITVTKTSQL